MHHGRPSHPAPIYLRRLLASALGVALVQLTLAAAPNLDALNSLTGSRHTRIVWLEGGDVLSGGGKLMGYDSRTNQSTTIAAAQFRQNRPILCYGGHRVVMTIDYRVYIVNWDGSDKRFITEGFCSDVWVHPQTGKEWAVVRLGADTTTGPVYRYQIDDPSNNVLLTDIPGRGAGYTSMNWHQLSQDGLVGVDLMPWPNCGYVRYDEPAQSPQTALRVAQGCWSSLAPDNSYYWFLFSSGVDATGHAGLALHREDTFLNNVWITGLDLPRNTQNNEFFHPRFASNGARFLVLTGGYERASIGEDETGNRVEVYFGKFNASFSGFDGWVRVTNNAVPDFCPDAWVGVSSASPVLELSATTLSFEVQEGSVPQPQTVMASTPYGTLSGLTAVSDHPWLSATPAATAGTQIPISTTVHSETLTSGLYTAQVTVRAENAVPSSTHYTVTVAVTGTAVPTAITISPAAARAVTGGEIPFSAIVKDQSGSPLTPQPPLSWTLAGTGDATLSQDGLLRAGTVLTTYVITVASGTLSAQASVEVRAQQPITILSPVGGEHFAVGGLLPIMWDAVQTVSGVTIYLSGDDGETWSRISAVSIDRTSEEWGLYSWNISPHVTTTAGTTVSTISEAATLRIIDYFDDAQQALVEQPFSIAAEMPVVPRQPAGSTNQWTISQDASGIVLEGVPWSPGHPFLHSLDGRVIDRGRPVGSTSCRMGAGNANQMQLLIINGNTARTPLLIPRLK